MTSSSTRSAVSRPRPSRVLGMLAYSSGNLGKAIVWTSFDTLLFYYLVRIAGFPALATGGLLAAVLLWDGCADIAVGYLADRHGRPDGLGRLILLGAPLCGASFWLIFALPPGDWRHVTLVAVVLCRTGYTLCDIGHNTLLVRVARTARDAATVSGMRLIFSTMGAALVGLAASAMLSGQLRHHQAAFARIALIGGIVYVVTLLLSVLATRRLSVGTAARRPAGAAAIFGPLWRNRKYRDVLALIALQSGLLPLFNRALPFVGEARHGGAGWAGTALTVIAIAQAVSLPFWMAMARWRSAHAMLAFAYAAMMLALGVLALRSGGSIGLVGLSLLGAAQAGMNMAIWALLAVSIQDGRVHGARSEALPVGLFLAVLKASAGAGNALLAGLFAIGHPQCSACDGDRAVPMIFAATLLPMLGCVLGLSLMHRFTKRGPFHQPRSS